MFVCLTGHQTNGHKFARDAAKNGAAAILVSEEISVESDATVIKVEDTRAALALVSAQFFEHPAKELTTIGITGTKGKTTTSFMIKSILEKSGIKTAIIGTLGVVLEQKIIKTANTTPESYEIQKYFRELADQGYECVVLEASSLGLKWNRLDGFVFDYCVFTNFSSDHIGEAEHKDLDEYLECKSLLFQKCKTGILNLDDEQFENILKGNTCKIITFGFNNNADFVAGNTKLISKPGYLGVHFKLSGQKSFLVDVSIPGKFSAYNALAAIAVCSQFSQITTKHIQSGLDSVKVKGRVESVETPLPFTLLIDYAHNALSMKNILTTLREYNPKRLVVMFGSGGNRPRIRRFEMGEIAGTFADFSVLTADNSRFEDVNDIIADIVVGMKRTNGEFTVIPDRKEAIRYCIESSKEGDVVVLAGKGHEEYQEVRGEKLPFDERKIIEEIIGSR
jgi:UDP-N-acetylmuramoyl-L-alanyl-D-glutamate--2,6-diaminopimelate ligase